MLNCIEGIFLTSKHLQMKRQTITSIYTAMQKGETKTIRESTYPVAHARRMAVEVSRRYEGYAFSIHKISDKTYTITCTASPKKEVS